MFSMGRHAKCNFEGVLFVSLVNAFPQERILLTALNR